MRPTRRRWWVAGAAAAAVGTLVGAAPARLVSCDFVCKGGGCSYKNCRDGPSCPGGACSFENCDRPSCRGGNCDFTACSSPVCRGGNCRFVDPLNTLRDGYCEGGACKVNGRPFPSRFTGKLSV